MARCESENCWRCAARRRDKGQFGRRRGGSVDQAAADGGAGRLRTHGRTRVGRRVGGQWFAVARGRARFVGDGFRRVSGGALRKTQRKIGEEHSCAHEKGRVRGFAPFMVVQAHILRITHWHFTGQRGRKIGIPDGDLTSIHISPRRLAIFGDVELRDRSARAGASSTYGHGTGFVRRQDVREHGWISILEHPRAGCAGAVPPQSRRSEPAVLCAPPCRR